MQLRVECGEHIVCDEELVRRVVEGTLGQFVGQVSGVEVQLQEVERTIPGERDKTCLIEASVAGLRATILASHAAPTLTEAIHVAAWELEKSVGSGLLHRRQSELSPPVLAEPQPSK